MAGQDPGGGVERTALAWQRTALAVVGGSVAVARLRFEAIGVVGLVFLTLSAVVSLSVLLESRGRHPHRGGLRVRPRPRGGRAALALALAVSAIGATELFSLLHGS
jgi:hypothetical protein